MKIFHFSFSAFSAATLVWSTPIPTHTPPGTSSPIVHSDYSRDHQGYIGSPSIQTTGLEHLIPHLFPEANPNEYHPTKHYGLMPDPHLYNRLYRQEHAPDSVIAQVGSSSRRLEKGKASLTMHPQEEMRSSGSFQNTEAFVNNFHRAATMDHDQVNELASGSFSESDGADSKDEQNNEEDEEDEGWQDDEDYHDERIEDANRRATGERPQEQVSRRALERNAKATFREIWNRRGLNTEMEPEVLAERLSFWKVDQEGGFDARQIGRRAVVMITETKPENQFPLYLARFGEYMREIEKAIRRVCRGMNKDYRFVEMYKRNKVSYDTVALEQALKQIHQSIRETGRYLTYRQMSPSQQQDFNRMMRTIINSLQTHLQQSQNVDINNADLPTMISGALALKIKGVNHWDIMRYIRHYLIEERGFNEGEIALFTRRARLANKSFIYYSMDPEIREETSRRKRQARARRIHADN